MQDSGRVTAAWQQVLQLASGAGPSIASVYFNATIWTGNAEAPTAEAFACSPDGLILAVSSSAGILAMGNHLTKRVDLQGSFVTPGLIDAHVHMLIGGSSLQQINLRGIASKADFVAAVQDAAVLASPGDWLLGHGWAEANWGGGLPSVTWIDHVTPKNPVMLSRMDMHMAVVNSEALRVAGLSDSAESPPGGRVDKDSQGKLTGILADHAMTLVSQHVPKQTHSDKHRALQTAARHLMSKVQDSADAWDTLENVYVPAADDGTLPVRLMAMVPLPTWRKLHDWVLSRGTSHPGGRLHWGGLKDFADGSLGSRTALMHQSYTDDPSSRGVRLTPKGTLQEMVTAADMTGLQIALHAIGDRANDEVAALYRSLPPVTQGNAMNSTSSEAVRRHRVEHAQHLSGPQALEALREAGVVAVTNPLHLMSDVDIIEARLGRGRAKPSLAFPSRALLQAGVAVAFGSDWPVMPAEPLATMHTAVNIDNLTLPSGALWGPGGSVSPEEALRAHTVGGAVACNLESEVGMLRPGMRADFSVFQHNLLDTLTGDVSAIPEVMATFVDGQCSFGCSAFPLAPCVAPSTAASAQSCIKDSQKGP
ncbi:TPA: hypothetical protein ACH3X1_006715 [Trebouxia sp. C0004]